MTLVSDTRLKSAFTTVSAADQSFLSLCQKAAEDVVQKYCNRTFAQTDYTELYNGSGTELLELAQFPVSKVTAVRYGLQAAIYIHNTDQANYNATAQVTSTGLVLTRSANATDTVVTLLYTDYPTIPALVAAVNALGHSWVATIGSDPFTSGWPSSDLKVFPGTHGVRLQVCSLLVHRWFMQNYRINEEIGEVWGWQAFPRGYQNIRVDYTAGYAADAIPEPVQAAVIEMARNTFNARPLNMNLNSQSLGAWSYSIAANTAFEQLSGPTRMGLSMYRRLVVPKWGV